MSQRSQGYQFEDYQGWLSFDTWQYEPSASRLIPTEKPLQFSETFIQACIEAPAEVGIGLYAMGWEL